MTVNDRIKWRVRDDGPVHVGVLLRGITLCHISLTLNLSYLPWETPMTCSLCDAELVLEAALREQQAEPASSTPSLGRMLAAALLAVLALIGIVAPAYADGPDVAGAIIADQTSRELYTAIVGTGAVVDVSIATPRAATGAPVTESLLVVGSNTSYCDDDGRCREFEIRLAAGTDLRSPAGVNRLRHELAHALAFARAGRGKHDDLGHPRPATFYEAYQVSGPREAFEAPAWYCWAAYFPYAPRIDPLTGFAVMPGPEPGTPEELMARREWTSCEVARTGTFQ